MITNSQVRVIESALYKLKPKLYGMKANYDCSIIEENVRWNLAPSEPFFKGVYRPILKIKIELSGQPDIYYVSPGIIEADLQQFFKKVFSYVLPTDHLLIKRPWSVVYEFKHNGKTVHYRDVITSFKYRQFLAEFRRDNSPGVLSPIQTIGYSINYSDLSVSEYGDQSDLSIFIECETESFNYVDNNQTILITDEIWNDFQKETEEDIDIVKESLISYMNTMSSDYGSALSEEFGDVIALGEKLPPKVADEFAWKYEAMCNSLLNPNDYPYDYSQGDVERKNLFLNYCHLNLRND